MLEVGSIHARPQAQSFMIVFFMIMWLSLVVAVICVTNPHLLWITWFSMIILLIIQVVE